jgi:hypothetical protein
MVDPFFPQQKRAVGSFLREVNVGIRSAPTPLAILKWNTFTDSVPDMDARDGCMHSWQCPPVSPHDVGVVCPIVLYGAKTVPPTRAERRQKTSIRRRHCTLGTGPNHRRSQRRHLRRNPRPITQTRSLFCTPRRRKQLRDWVFPHTNDSHEAPGSTYKDDDNDTTDFNLSLHMSTLIDKITDNDDIIPRKSRSPSPAAPRQDAPRRRHTAVTQRHAPS